MSIAFGLAIYFICWWITLFTILPLGVRTQQEDGDVTPGSVESAPTSPQIRKKFIITTVVSAIIFAGIYAVIEYKLITLDDFPF